MKERDELFIKAERKQKYAILYSQLNRPFALLAYTKKNKDSLSGCSVICCAKNDASRFEIKNGIPMQDSLPIKFLSDNLFVSETEEGALDIFYKKIAAYLSEIKEGWGWKDFY